MMVETGKLKMYLFNILLLELSSIRKVSSHIWKNHLRLGRISKLRQAEVEIHEDELRGLRSSSRNKKQGLGAKGRSGCKVWAMWS